MQKDDEDHWHPMEYWTHKLTDEQYRRHPTLVQLETLAITEATKCWRHHLQKDLTGASTGILPWCSGSMPAADQARRPIDNAQTGTGVTIDSEPASAQEYETRSADDDAHSESAPAGVQVHIRQPELGTDTYRKILACALGHSDLLWSDSSRRL